MSFVKAVKRPIRKVGVQLGLLKDWDAYFALLAEPGRERAADFYNTQYESSPGYDSDYTQSEYYFLWSIIADRIAASKSKRILEVGCGSGQFALLLNEQGLHEYLGCEFSEVAIGLAQKRVPDFTFQVDDALKTSLFESYSSDWIVCTEVLEHLDQDRELVQRFPKGTHCLCTVPNFPFSSHVRHFETEEEVIERYSEFFENFSVRTLRGIRNDDEKFFLMDGVRA